MHAANTLLHSDGVAMLGWRNAMRMDGRLHWNADMMDGSATTLALIARIALGLALVYLLLLTLLFVFQSRLIHLPGIPGRELTASPSDIGLDYEDVHIATADGLQLHAWYVPAVEERGVVLFFHGNAGNISHRLDSIALFNELGLSVLIPDYRGYGRSEGRPSEAGLYRDADAALAYLIDQRGVSPERLIVFGRSLGAAVAAHVASQETVAALVLESAFTSVADMAAELYPIFPVRALVRQHYPTLEHMQRSDAPLLIIHSPDDEIIPFRHGQTLYESGPEARRLLEIEGDHNTGFLRSRSRYLDGWQRFLEEYVH
jgi:uncharacterized protein